MEETAEACEAIDENDAPHLQEELGDVLYQVVFHADLEREAGRFSMDDVIDGICKKLIARHPFLFGASGAARPDETQALEGWEARKRELRGNPTIAAQMRDVCKTLPGLWRAEKLCKKAATLDPQTAQTTAAQLADAHTALQAACAAGQDAGAQLGTLLFSAAQLAQCLSLDPEQYLHAACEDYMRQITARESIAQTQK